MSRDNLCIGLERYHVNDYPLTCELFRKIIDNYKGLSQVECMMLYDIFRTFCEEREDEFFATHTYLV